MGAGWTVTDATSVEVGRRTGRLPALAPQAYYWVENNDYLAGWICDYCGSPMRRGNYVVVCDYFWLVCDYYWVETWRGLRQLRLAQCGR